MLMKIIMSLAFIGLIGTFIFLVYAFFAGWSKAVDEAKDWLTIIAGFILIGSGICAVMGFFYFIVWVFSKIWGFDFFV